jgi:hypothetical protein
MTPNGRTRTSGHFFSDFTFDAVQNRLARLQPAADSLPALVAGGAVEQQDLLLFVDDDGLQGDSQGSKGSSLLAENSWLID